MTQPDPDFMSLGEFLATNQADRDLIAEGRRLLPAPGELLTSGEAFDLAEWAGLNLGLLLDIVEELRRQLLGHEKSVQHMRQQRDEARARITELEQQSRGRKIASAAELDALPRGSAVLTPNGRVWQKANLATAEWWPALSNWTQASTSERLLGLGVVTVLHIPAEAWPQLPSVLDTAAEAQGEWVRDRG